MAGELTLWLQLLFPHFIDDAFVGQLHVAFAVKVEELRVLAVHLSIRRDAVSCVAGQKQTRRRMAWDAALGFVPPRLLAERLLLLLRLSTGWLLLGIPQSEFEFSRAISGPLNDGVDVIDCIGVIEGWLPKLIDLVTPTWFPTIKSSDGFMLRLPRPEY